MGGNLGKYFPCGTQFFNKLKKQMLSSNIHALALTFLASIAQGQVIMSVVGGGDPLNTVVSTKLGSDPKREISFIPSSTDPSVLFSDCGLTFNSSNYNVPQVIHLRRKTFTPFAKVRTSQIPDQVFDLVLSEIGTQNLYTLPIVWKPKPSKIVSWWGDPHFDKVINDLAPNGQGSFQDAAVVQMPRSKYFSVLKSKNDWEVSMFTFPYGAVATTHTRLCVRNVNNVICANGNGTITYLNPASQDAYPIEVMKVGNEIQFLLPSGSAIETIPSTWSMTTRITIQPSDLGGLSGIGNNTLLHYTSSASLRKAFVDGFELPSAIQKMLTAPNMTNNLQFSSSNFSSPLAYSACVPGSSRAELFVKKIIISSFSTVTESIDHHVTNTKTATHVAEVNVTRTTTNWVGITQDSVTVKGATSTNPIIASATVTVTNSATVTSKVIVGGTTAVGTTTTVSTQVFATSTNIIRSTVLVEKNVTRTNNHEATLTNVAKETKTMLKTDYDTKVETKYLTESIRGADVTKTVDNYETDTFYRTVKVTSTKNIDEFTTIVGQDAVDITQVIKQTSTVNVDHKVTDTIHRSENLERTAIHLQTLVNIEDVTTTAIGIEPITSTRSHTSTLSTTTNVQVFSTLVKEEEVTTHTTSTNVVSSTQVSTAQETTTIKSQVDTTTTEVVDQYHTVGQTNSHTVTVSYTSQQYSTKTETVLSTIETHSKSTVYHQTSAQLTSIHTSTIVIDRDTQETLTDAAAMNAIVYTTIYNPVVVFVTTNQTDGTTTFTETNLFTEVATVTRFADPIFTTVTAQA